MNPEKSEASTDRNHDNEKQITLRKLRIQLQVLNDTIYIVSRLIHTINSQFSISNQTPFFTFFDIYLRLNLLIEGSRYINQKKVPPWFHGLSLHQATIKHARLNERWHIIDDIIGKGNSPQTHEGGGIQLPVLTIRDVRNNLMSRIHEL